MSISTFASPKTDRHILHIITGLSDGGAEAILYRLCSDDKDYYHQVVSLGDAGKYGPLLMQADVPVVCLGMPRGRLTITGLWRLWRLLRQARPAVVQTWMYHADLVGGVLARLAGVRKVFWGIHHTTLEPTTSRRSTIAVARLCARLSRWVPSGIVCCAERARVVHQTLGYAAEKCTVIHNGYDLQLFQPDVLARTRLRQEWGVSAATPLLGMVGRFDPQKNHAGLLRALSNIKNKLDFHCVLVGSGVDNNNTQLVAWIAQYNLHDVVRLLGQRTDIPSVMNALDIHVLSSLSEAFPNVLAEAMACGTPCVTTDVGDAAMIVGDTGWVVPPADHQRLADALIDALEKRGETAIWQARMQATRARITEHFGLKKMRVQYHTVWGWK